ncbi:hypothetical protein POM88_002532 [Heracleum sosnowskyi]|uniref:Uncharacterized protein n=1 Tax=Heracleum sosnowskyi TaxID=360622 RepID=A0AAD8JI47_9APIA|nr:hypothetical protein POM88_002532 [Heracleum sosnowskyi]
MQILDQAHNKSKIEKKVHSVIDNFAECGLRSLGVARQEVPEGNKDSSGGPSEFIALLPLFDPVHHDSGETIRRALKLGFSVKMITGINLWSLKKDLPCHGTTQYYSLFINYGGPKIEAGGKEYEEDFVTEGESYFFPTDLWAYSSIGVFMYNDRSNLVASNTNVTACE